MYLIQKQLNKSLTNCGTYMNKQVSSSQVIYEILTLKDNEELFEYYTKYYRLVRKLKETHLILQEAFLLVMTESYAPIIAETTEYTFIFKTPTLQEK